MRPAQIGRVGQSRRNNGAFGARQLATGARATVDTCLPAVSAALLGDQHTRGLCADHTLPVTNFNPVEQRISDSYTFRTLLGSACA